MFGVSLDISYLCTRKRKQYYCTAKISIFSMLSNSKNTSFIRIRKIKFELLTLKVATI